MPLPPLPGFVGAGRLGDKSKTEVNFILTLRSKTLNIAANFQSSQEPKKPCKACVLSFETEEHFYGCVGLSNSSLSTEDLNNIKYDDLFPEDAGQIITESEK